MKLGFTLRRHAELVSASSRFIGGFTLIELLVVVLIIGVLAAVAVPQYKLAVAKSRLATFRTTMLSVKRAAELYYLQKGSKVNGSGYYFKDLGNVSGVDLSTSCSVWFGDVYRCGDWRVNPHAEYLYMAYCPKSTVWLDCYTKEADYDYRLWYSYSTKPNKEECVGHTPLGNKLCSTIKW